MTYTGDGYSGIYIWGAQVEQGSFPTSYIKTTGSQVTRSADSAEMTGTNFTDWYNYNEGSWYSQFKPTTGNTSGYILYVGNDISNNFRFTYGSPTRYQVYTNGLNYSYTTIGNSTSSNNKASFGYKTNDATGSLNGANNVNDTSVLIPNVEPYLKIISSTNGYIKKISYYPLRLTNNEIQDLTEE